MTAADSTEPRAATDGTEQRVAGGAWVESDLAGTPAEELTPAQLAGLAALRIPFAPESVGLLPKPYRKDAEKGTCPTCGGYHGMPAMHIDYVGHAATTDRLLTIDPLWSWEPLAFGPNGLPQLDGKGGLWIRLTILGVTRIGYGDGPDPKVLIGDAIRNAAMRFGLALNLWTKDETLESQIVPPAPPKAPETAQEFAQALMQIRTLAELTGLRRDAELAERMDGAVTIPTRDGTETVPLRDAFDLRRRRIEPDPVQS